MADTTVATGASGAPIRVLSGLGAGPGDQQVVSIADQNGNLVHDQSAAVSISAVSTAGGTLTGLSGIGTATLQLSAISGTVVFQVTADGSNWVSVTGSNQVTAIATGAYLASGAITATGVYQLDITGVVGVRAYCTAYTSTITGVLRACTATGAVSIEGVPAVTATATLNASANVVGAVGIGATTQSASYYTSTTTATATQAKASAGSIQSLWISNTSTSAQWVKLYNATAVTLGTTAAVVDIPVSAGQSIPIEPGANGARFTAGIAYAVTGAVGATNSTAPVAGVLIVLTYV